MFELNNEGGPLSGTLTDLTEDVNGNESADVQGEVLGVSEDGTYVYFVASGALAEHAVKGNRREASGLCNLYMDHDTAANGSPPCWLPCSPMKTKATG